MITLWNCIMCNHFMQYMEENMHELAYLIIVAEVS